jgi:hypothetical protein
VQVQVLPASLDKTARRTALFICRAARIERARTRAPPPALCARRATAAAMASFAEAMAALAEADAKVAAARAAVDAHFPALGRSPPAAALAGLARCVAASPSAAALLAVAALGAEAAGRLAKDAAVVRAMTELAAAPQSEAVTAALLAAWAPLLCEVEAAAAAELQQNLAGASHATAATSAAYVGMWRGIVDAGGGGVRRLTHPCEVAALCCAIVTAPALALAVDAASIVVHAFIATPALRRQHGVAAAAARAALSLGVRAQTPAHRAAAMRLASFSASVAPAEFVGDGARAEVPSTAAGAAFGLTTSVAVDAVALALDVVTADGGDDTPVLTNDAFMLLHSLARHDARVAARVATPALVARVAGWATAQLAAGATVCQLRPACCLLAVLAATTAPPSAAVAQLAAALLPAFADAGSDWAAALVVATSRTAEGTRLLAEAGVDAAVARLTPADQQARYYLSPVEWAEKQSRSLADVLALAGAAPREPAAAYVAAKSAQAAAGHEDVAYFYFCQYVERQAAEGAECAVACAPLRRGGYVGSPVNCRHLFFAEELRAALREAPRCPVCRCAAEVGGIRYAYVPPAAKRRRQEDTEPGADSDDDDDDDDDDHDDDNDDDNDDDDGDGDGDADSDDS